MSDLGNKLVVCPYDKRHVMPEKRYMWHLSMNCKAHQEKKAEFMLCPFNSLHRIAKESFEEHLKLCENKDDYKIEREERELYDMNEKLMGMDLEKEGENESHWGYFWEQSQKKIEKEGVGNKWSDQKENELWGIE